MANDPRRTFVRESRRQLPRGTDPGWVDPLAPAGFVRVHGELWQAKLADGDAWVPQGEGVRVRAIEGLVLLVEPDLGQPLEHAPRSPTSSPSERR